MGFNLKCEIDFELSIFNTYTCLLFHSNIDAHFDPVICMLSLTLSSKTILSKGGHLSVNDILADMDKYIWHY